MFKYLEQDASIKARFDKHLYRFSKHKDRLLLTVALTIYIESRAIGYVTYLIFFDFHRQIIELDYDWFRHSASCYLRSGLLHRAFRRDKPPANRVE